MNYEEIANEVIRIATEAGAEAEAQISTRTRIAHRIGVRWANEDQIADQDRAIGFDDPPTA